MIMNLSLLILLPLLTALGILFCKNPRQVRQLSLAGALAQLVLAFILLYMYWQEKRHYNKRFSF